ncbi:MAG: universal stress protein [Parahaliea sp.]
MGKLLVVADLEGRCVAIPRGLELARSIGHSVELVAFVWTSLKGLKLNPAETAKMKQRLLNEREKEMEARIDRYRKDGDQITLKVIWSKDMVAWINRRVEGGKYAAVLKTGRRSESVVHTPSDWQLLRECPVPVYILARDKWGRTEPVLAALDLGTDNRAKQRLNRTIIAKAKTLAGALNAELKFICALEVPALLAELDIVDPTAYANEQKKRMEPLISELAEESGLPRSVFSIKRGPVAKVINSEAARLRAQLVVVGCVGRKGVKARLLGNTAESVLELLHTDILAIKP